MTKKVAIYARVSTDDQADKGYSLPSQLDGCRQYIDQLGYSVVVEFREDHSGVTPVTERPQGKRLTEMIKFREVDAVVVYQVDRLSRDIVDLLTTVRNWLRVGVEVYALDVGKIESELDIVLVIKGWQGSDERKKIRERSMRGKRAKARTGRVVGARAPYGYDHVRDENGGIVNFEPVEEEAQIVRLIFQWYVMGDETGQRLSAGKIAKRLSEMKILTPGETNAGYHRTRKSGMWHPYAILDIIARETYAGIWRFGVRIGPTRIKRPKEEWIEIEVPALVDRTTWERAQELRELNKQFSRRNAKHDYLLSGLVRCACGKAMSGEFFSNHQYYTCTWRNNHHSNLEERTCKARSVRADAIEVDVWDSIVGLFANLKTLEKHLRIAQQEELAALDPKLEELSAVESMIFQAEADALEIGQAFRRATGLVARSLEQNMNEVNMRYDALCRRRETLQVELSVTRLTDSAIQELVEFAQDVFVGIENADFHTKRRNLEMLKVQVEISQRHFTINCLAGQISGEIRKLPIATKSGIVTDLHSRDIALRGFRFRAMLPPLVG
ncbi:MAG: recombinase family protein [Anaerolineales bacterium]|nr:recombinase family protein [Anaerolineales bacterium]